ncbi:MAG: hypothetical protein KGJ89_02030 [Patescibacteria group bacterium]|nr:hypothetical protein [Patescibacteria group bacterium]MDE2015655.1 hypothetical protein [Patescibacteria group bacterium]MDE2226712.1 hypothetical protein [Patescibacteria group bacterium]
MPVELTEVAELDALNKKILELTQQRDNTLRELRKKCNHLRLVEIDSSSPPMRICADCGAEERGWYCGYHVLIMSGDTWIDPYKDERTIVKKTSSMSEFNQYRKAGSRYPVGQSHPNFGKPRQSREQLTEIP